MSLLYLYRHFRRGGHSVYRSFLKALDIVWRDRLLNR